MANVYPDQEMEIDPLWCNTATALAAGGEISPLPCGNATALGGGADSSLRGVAFSILVYVAVMLLVLLPLCPCFRCDEERDYRDKKRYIQKRKADILADVITKPAQEHGDDQNFLDPAKTMKEASTHGTFEIGNLVDNDEEEKVTACVSIDFGSPPSIDTIETSSSATEIMTDNDMTAISQQSSGGRLVCSICLEAFEVGEEVSWSRNTDCNHCYHQDCISQWLIKHDECPVCRSDYLFDDWKLNQLRPSEHLFSVLPALRRSPPRCTCIQVDDVAVDERRDCVFCVTHGLESPSGTTLCETALTNKKNDDDLEAIDLEAGRGGNICRADITPVPEAKNAEELAKPCPVHGQGGRNSRRIRNRQTHNTDVGTSTSESARWYENRLRETWWAMSSRHLGMRLEDSPSYAARSRQYT
jgi:hypothetical protein